MAPTSVKFLESVLLTLQHTFKHWRFMPSLRLTQTVRLLPDL